jgi:hypothetical protein
MALWVQIGNHLEAYWAIVMAFEEDLERVRGGLGVMLEKYLE